MFEPPYTSIDEHYVVPNVDRRILRHKNHEKGGQAFASTKQQLISDPWRSQYRWKKILLSKQMNDLVFCQFMSDLHLKLIMVPMVSA